MRFEEWLEEQAAAGPFEANMWGDCGEEYLKKALELFLDWKAPPSGIPDLVGRALENIAGNIGTALWRSDLGSAGRKAVIGAAPQFLAQVASSSTVPPDAVVSFWEELLDWQSDSEDPDGLKGEAFGALSRQLNLDGPLCRASALRGLRALRSKSARQMLMSFARDSPDAALSALALELSGGSEWS